MIHFSSNIFLFKEKIVWQFFVIVPPPPTHNYDFTKLVKGQCSVNRDIEMNSIKYNILS